MTLLMVVGAVLLLGQDLVELGYEYHDGHPERTIQTRSITGPCVRSSRQSDWKTVCNRLQRWREQSANTFI